MNSDKDTVDTLIVLSDDAHPSQHPKPKKLGYFYDDLATWCQTHNSYPAVEINVKYIIIIM